jgi:hypothetical protein
VLLSIKLRSPPSFLFATDFSYCNVPPPLSSLHAAPHPLPSKIMLIPMRAPPHLRRRRRRRRLHHYLLTMIPLAPAPSALPPQSCAAALPPIFLPSPVTRPPPQPAALQTQLTLAACCILKAVNYFKWTPILTVSPRLAQLISAAAHTYPPPYLAPPSAFAKSLKKQNKSRGRGGGGVARGGGVSRGGGRGGRDGTPRGGGGGGGKGRGAQSPENIVIRAGGVQVCEPQSCLFFATRLVFIFASRHCSTHPSPARCRLTAPCTGWRVQGVFLPQAHVHPDWSAAHRELKR